MRLFISSPISPAAVHAGGWRWALTCGALEKTFEKEKDDAAPLELNVGRGYDLREPNAGACTTTCWNKLVTHKSVSMNAYVKRDTRATESNVKMSISSHLALSIKSFHRKPPYPSYSPAAPRFSKSKRHSISYYPAILFFILFL